MRAETRQKIVQEITNWRHDGLLDAATAAILAERYAGGPGMLSTLLRWLGFFAVFLLAMSILGLVGLGLGDFALLVAPPLLAALSAAAWYFGVQMAIDPGQRYPLSGAVLITVGLVGVFAALSWFYVEHIDDGYTTALPWFLLATAGAALATAWRHGLRWPLGLGILLAFHALGNWHGYAGHGGYFLGVRDERLTAVGGAIAIAFGLWHEYRREADAAHSQVGFGHLFIVFGLFYLNLSFWFLSLGHSAALAWVLAFTAVAIGQLVIGARLHDARFVGFGLVFLAIDFYTRFFEHFWDELSKGLFFLIAGGIGVGAGAALEYRARRGRSTDRA